MAFHRSRRWKSGSMPPSFWDSSHTRLWMPAAGFQWNFTSDDSPAAFTRRKVWTPKPSIVRYERGMARSDMTHISMWVRLGLERDEVPERVVGRLGLGDLAVGFGLHGVDEVGELDAVLDEEHRDVVADQIEVALGRVELHREAADVAGGVGRAPRAGHGREPDEHRGRRPGVGQDPRRGDVGQRVVQLEAAVGAGAAGVHDPLGDALVVEVRDLLAQVKSSSRVGPPTGPQRVVGVFDAQPLRRRQRIALLSPAQGHRDVTPSHARARRNTGWRRRRRRRITLQATTAAPASRLRPDRRGPRRGTSTLGARRSATSSRDAWPGPTSSRWP